MLDTMTVNNKVTEPETPAIETRLTTAQVIVALSNMGVQLDHATAAYKKLIDETPKEIPELLKTIQSACTATTQCAERLLLNNRGK